MDDENIVLLDFSEKEPLSFDDKFYSQVKKIHSMDGRAKVIIDFKGFPLSSSLINSLTNFYSKHGSLISSTAFCGVGNGVRKVILKSTGIPALFADGREQAIELINEPDGEDVL